MLKNVPFKLLAVAVGLLAAGLAAGPIIQFTATPEQLTENVLLNAIPFILIFAAIVLTFIAAIAFTARVLNNNVPASTHRMIESLLIAGIVSGVLGMFQPWLFVLYKYGFLLLLCSTLGFILWSHVVPHKVRQQE